MQFNYWNAVFMLNLFWICFELVSAKVVQLTSSNFDSYLENAEFAFVNFYADWCRFSQMLNQTFEDASNAFANDDRILFAKVDCDAQGNLAQNQSISKYPTLKYYFFGQPSKREFRLKRQTDVLIDFVRNKSASAIQFLTSKDELDSKVEKSQRAIVLYSRDNDSIEMRHLKKISALLRDDCQFYAGIGEAFSDMTDFGNTLLFRPAEGSSKDQLKQTGALLQNFDYLKQWITDKCIPLIREITFENAEELTEEGRPFLILFKLSHDTETLDMFSKLVATELMDQRDTVNFLHADGIKFAHPLHHLGKSTKDLPIIAIDSFRHMYTFQHMHKLNQTGVLRQFVMDLHSGKLHREMHYGPDPTEVSTKEQPQNDQTVEKSSPPPPSVFQKLKPSYQRYTLLRDEL